MTAPSPPEPDQDPIANNLRRVLPPELLTKIETLMANDRFCHELDRLSLDLIELVAAFWRAHPVPFDGVRDGFEIEVVFALVIGWVLGFPAAKATKERCLDVAMRQLLVAACGAGWSMHACRATARRDIQ